MKLRAGEGIFHCFNKDLKVFGIDWPDFPNVPIQNAVIVIISAILSLVIEIKQSLNLDLYSIYSSKHDFVT